jgi:hypothetical protein
MVNRIRCLFVVKAALHRVCKKINKHKGHVWFFHGLIFSPCPGWRLQGTASGQVFSGFFVGGAERG